MPRWVVIKGGQWFNSRGIQIICNWDSVWDNYINSLNSAGIRLGNSYDINIFVWNKKSRKISAKDTYDALINTQFQFEIRLLNLKLWILHIP